jgi:hypothetical protein
VHWKLLELEILEQLPSLRISAIFGQPGNVMNATFYDIITEVIAAQRFVALALLALARKCHEMCGCVMFRQICEGGFSPEERTLLG